MENRKAYRFLRSSRVAPLPDAERLQRADARHDAPERHRHGVPLVQRIATDQGSWTPRASPGGDFASLVLLGAERAALVVGFAGHYLRHCPSWTTRTRG